MNVLIDTNILIYAWDSGKKERQAKAIQTLQEYQAQAYLSVQNLSEFTSFMIRQNRDSTWVERVVKTYQEVLTILPLKSEYVLDAIQGVQQHKLSYWDAQIWAVAKRNQVPTILSEDGPTGQTIQGVTYMNPFA